MSASASPNGVDAILKAIDEEHREMQRGAQAIYAAQMKPARAQLEIARKAWNDAQAAFRREEQARNAEKLVNGAEADRRRLDLRQAELKTRPAKMSNVATKVARSRDGGAITLPLLPHEARAE